MIQHARRLLYFLALAVACVAAPLGSASQAQVPFRQLIPANSSKYAAIVVDAKSGEVLYSQRADSPRYPASITKVMTLYLTFEALASGKLKLEDRVVFSPHAAAQAPTKLGIRAGDSITVAEAIQSLTTLSANDTAVAIAERIGGTERRFTTLMTLRAKELGMQDTNFANPNGLPDSRNLSTARDLAILSRAVMRDFPQYYSYFNQTSFSFRGRTYRNHNRLLTNVPGVDGLKTGFTNASGYNIAVSGVRDGRRLVVVVMGGPTSIARDRTAEALLLTGFDVIGRRAAGEQITLAQNFFEPSDMSGRAERSNEQGDREGEDLKIVLASAAPPMRSASIEVVEPRSVKAAGKWTVQVGSFRARDDARRQLRISARQFETVFKNARAVAEKDSGRYRARFEGFSESGAKAACRTLKARSQPCMVLPPG